MLAFIDDLHMPTPAAHGCMPPLELLKLWADHGIWCGLTCSSNAPGSPSAHPSIQSLHLREAS